MRHDGQSLPFDAAFVGVIQRAIFVGEIQRVAQ